jgi:phage repressor protein C with HTH and peptisase S24 domain
MTKDEVEKKLAELGKDRHWLANETGYSYDSLKNLLAPKARELSFAMTEKIKQAFNSLEKTIDTIDPVNDLIMRPTYEQFLRWNKIALSEGKLIEDWAFDELEEAAAEYFAEQQINITTMPQAKPNIWAAAGEPIHADCIEWNDKEGIVTVGAVGNSMVPLVEDGETLIMKHRSKSRSPFMKKGLIYLVCIEGKYTIKKYGTRPARPDEKDAEYLTQSGTVGQLLSLNQDHDPIDITTTDVKWDAWYQPK